MLKTRTQKKEKVTRSSGNILAALFPDANELSLIRLQAALLTGKAIKRQGLSQRAAAVKLGIKQPDVSRILNGQLERFALPKTTHAAAGSRQ